MLLQSSHHTFFHYNACSTSPVVIVHCPDSSSGTTDNSPFSSPIQTELMNKVNICQEDIRS